MIDDLRSAVIEHLEKGDAEGAIGCFQTALDKAGATDDQAAILKLMGSFVLEVLGDPAKALECYGRVLELTPADPEALYCTALCHADAGDHDEAIQTYDRALALDPTNAALHYNRGNTLQAMGRIDDAIAAFDEAIRHAPDDADAYINKGRLLDDTGRHAEAIELYDRALSLSPDESIAMSNRGNSLKSLGRHEDALRDYEASLAIEPDMAAYVGQAFCFHALGRTDDAIAAWQTLMPQATWFAEGWNDLGICLSETDDHAGALDVFDKAVELQQDNPGFSNNRAEALFRLERFDDAIAEFDRALDLAPDYTAPLFGKARTYVNMKRYDDAVAPAQRYLELAEPDDDKRPVIEMIIARSTES